MLGASLKIGKGSEFLEALGEDGINAMGERFGAIGRFLDPDDTFRFECDKSGFCCKDRFGSPIIINPYDVMRLRKRLGITSIQLLQQFADLTWGAESEIPLALLRYDDLGKGKNKCPFLRSYGCRVYEDRPLRCRLYPLGRATDLEGTSYFFIMKTGPQCGLGKGKSHTIQSWLEESGAEDHLLWSDEYNKLITGIDHRKYRMLDTGTKFMFGLLLYDCDTLKERLAEQGLEYVTEDDDDFMTLSLNAAGRYIEQKLREI
jgi:Fe-S-cluster containining protein